VGRRKHRRNPLTKTFGRAVSKLGGMTRTEGIDFVTGLGGKAHHDPPVPPAGVWRDGKRRKRH
jgi:hypothetical protein